MGRPSSFQDFQEREPYTIRTYGSLQRRAAIFSQDDRLELLLSGAYGTALAEK